MRKDQPVIIEVAINGETPKERNPNVPRTPDEIGADALACVEAGAAIIHGHADDLKVSGKAAAERYAEGWKKVREARPDAILYPTVVMSEDQAERFAHLPFLAEAGVAQMASLDPGTTNLAINGPNGLPVHDFVYVNSYSEIRYAFDIFSELGLGASMALYDASYCRAVLAWHRAGKLPKGSFPKFYFAGDYDFMSGKKGGMNFGFNATEKALDAYVEMLDGTGLPWAAAVLGGDLVGCGLGRHVIERGGHLRIGLEDYAGPDTPTNLDLLEAAVALCREVGRAVATPDQAKEILGM
jgi:3-keto-5-aminohexanoate cleavage enzyme